MIIQLDLLEVQVFAPFVSHTSAVASVVLEICIADLAAEELADLCGPHSFWTQAQTACQRDVHVAKPPLMSGEASQECAAALQPCARLCARCKDCALVLCGTVCANVFIEQSQLFLGFQPGFLGFCPSWP